MYNNTFGNIFRLTSFGESHGKAIGGVIDGFPAGIAIDMDFIQQELDRRRPGQSAITTARKEADQVEFLSGIYEGVSTGCSIGFVVWNTNQHSNDYNNMKDVFRPSHADFTYTQKYGIRDHRGGGRSSARETIARVVAGTLAKLALRQLGVRITAFTSQVGEFKLDKDYTAYDLSTIEDNPVRCPDQELAKQMADYIYQTKGEGDTIGGVISCVIQGCPIGLGQPVFGKLHAALGNAMLSINAVKGFEYGQGFSHMEMKGSQQNDIFYRNGEKSSLPHQPLRRYSGRYQQRPGYLFPRSLQAGSYGIDGTAYSRHLWQRNYSESPRTSRPLCVTSRSPHCGSYGSYDDTRLLSA